jgi:hypothetical protein
MHTYIFDYFIWRWLVYKDVNGKAEFVDEFLSEQAAKDFCDEKNKNLVVTE